MLPPAGPATWLSGWRQGSLSDDDPTGPATADGIPRYPEGAPADEQRRAHVLEAIGGAAAEMDTQTLCQMVIDLAEMLRTGVPPTRRKLRPVP